MAEKSVELDERQASYLAEMLSVRNQVNASIQSVVSFACLGAIDLTPQTPWELRGGKIVVTIPDEPEKSE